jgi:ribosome-associated protein
MILTVVLEDLADHLDPRVVDRLRRLAANRISQAGVLRIASDEYRSQAANRAACRERLDALIQRAKIVPKRRRKTKIPRGVREKRLKNKKRRGQLKTMRREKFN